MEHGADVNKEINGGETPLFEACLKGNENIVKYLVEHGADINKENIFRFTPLVYAINSGNDNTIEYLIENEANINKVIYEKMSNINVKNINLLKYLIEHGLDINKKNIIGKTLLIDACIYENENVVKYLVEHGADVNGKDNDGYTPLFYACYNKNRNIIKYLVEHGAYINDKNKPSLFNSWSKKHGDNVNHLIKQPNKEGKIGNKHYLIYGDNKDEENEWPNLMLDEIDEPEGLNLFDDIFEVDEFERLIETEDFIDINEILNRFYQ